jgi:hypothetical protein
MSSQSTMTPPSNSGSITTITTNTKTYEFSWDGEKSPSYDEINAHLTSYHLDTDQSINYTDARILGLPGSYVVRATVVTTQTCSGSRSEP